MLLEFLVGKTNLLIDRNTISPPSNRDTVLKACRHECGSVGRKPRPADRGLKSCRPGEARGKSSFLSPEIRSAPPLHQMCISVEKNSPNLGGKSSLWSSTIRSFAENRKMYILINFDRNRRASEVQGRMPTCPQGPGQKALHQRGLRRFPRFPATTFVTLSSFKVGGSYTPGTGH